MATSVHINKSIKITPTPLQLNSCLHDNEEIKITFTSSIGVAKDINVRLISAQLREGQVNLEDVHLSPFFHLL